MQGIAAFNPVSALVGGAMIGLAAVLLAMLTGRIAGVSGILGGCLAPASGDTLWRYTFILGLLLAPVAGGYLGNPLPAVQLPTSWAVIVIAGFLVGFGARLSGGCTSGHGVCGIARLSKRSIVATAIFMATGIATVAVVRHGLGG
jgi:uncharacterized membrane protein YedE/YeeE